MSGAGVDLLAGLWDAPLEGLGAAAGVDTVPVELLAGGLQDLVPGELDDGQALLAVRDCERLIGLVQGWQQRFLARFADLRPGRPGGLFGEYAPDEVACELGLSRTTAGARLALAAELTGRLPGTLAALERGLVDLPKARMLAEVTDPLPAPRAALVEDG